MKKVLELLIRDAQIIKYKYFDESPETLEILDLFFLPLKVPIIYPLLPIDIYVSSYIKLNGDEIRKFYKIDK